MDPGAPSGAVAEVTYTAGTGPYQLQPAPPTIGQVLEWDGTEWCPATLPPPVATFPLCPTPPTNGQVLIWDAINNEWCPADFCTLVAACMMPPITSAAVHFTGSEAL